LLEPIETEAELTPEIVESSEPPEVPREAEREKAAASASREAGQRSLGGALAGEEIVAGKATRRWPWQYFPNRYPKVRESSDF
jgi:hypothetical protein